MRTGLIAEKKGMSRVFTEYGRHLPVTVIAGCAKPRQVRCQTALPTRDGYTAVQLQVTARQQGAATWSTSARCVDTSPRRSVEAKRFGLWELRLVRRRRRGTGTSVRNWRLISFEAGPDR